MSSDVTDLIELQNVLETMKRDLPALLQDSLNIAEQLYEPLTSETWTIIGDLVQKMDQLYRQARFLNDALAELPDNEELQAAIEHFVRQFPVQFQAMNDCMDQEDYRDAADWLKYELAESIRVLSRMLGDEINAMEERYQKNLSYLSEKFPGVYEVVAGKDPDWTNYQIIYSKTGIPNLKIRTGENKWVKFYSSYDPEAEVARWASNLIQKMNNSDEIIFYGLGFGYHLLMLNMQLPHAKLSIYEPDEQIFIAAMHAIDLESLLSRVNVASLCVGGDKTQRERMIYKFITMSKASPSVHALPVYERLNIHEMLAFSEDAKLAAMKYVTSVSTFGQYGKNWLRNRLYNLSAILKSPSIRNFKELFAGKTAVIVGAGPSLEADIPALRELKNHALIIAAGSTVQSLLHFGIVPHFVVIVDGGNINLKVYENPAIRSIPLLFAPMAHYQVIDAHEAGKTVHFFLKDDYTTWFLMGLGDNDPTFRLIPSVTGNAIETAIYMGCTEIVLVGQDLSYPGNRIYASGAKHVSEKEQLRFVQNTQYQVENVNGGVNRASHAMVVILRSIEALLSEYPEIVFTNTAKYGAKIKHTRWEPLDSVVDRLRSQEVPADVFERLAGMSNVLYGEAQKLQISARLSELADQVDELDQQLARITDKLERLPKYSRQHPKRCIQYMRDIETEWAQIVIGAPFQTLMTTLIMNQIRIFDRNRPELEKETDVNRKAQLFVEVLGPLIKTMRSIIPELKDMIGTAIERIKD